MLTGWYLKKVVKSGYTGITPPMTPLGSPSRPIIAIFRRYKVWREYLVLYKGVWYRGSGIGIQYNRPFISNTTR